MTMMSNWSDKQPSCQECFLCLNLGINPSTFLNVEIFRLEIKKRIAEASEDSEKLIDTVREEVAAVIDEVIQDSFGEFPELVNQI